MFQKLLKSLLNPFLPIYMAEGNAGDPPSEDPPPADPPPAPDGMPTGLEESFWDSEYY